MRPEQKAALERWRVGRDNPASESAERIYSWRESDLVTLADLALVIVAKVREWERLNKAIWAAARVSDVFEGKRLMDWRQVVCDELYDLAGIETKEEST